MQISAGVLIVLLLTTALPLDTIFRSSFYGICTIPGQKSWWNPENTAKIAKSAHRRCLHNCTYLLNFETIFGIELQLDMEPLIPSLEAQSSSSAASAIFWSWWKVKSCQNTLFPIQTSAVFAFFLKWLQLYRPLCPSRASTLPPKIREETRNFILKFEFFFVLLSSKLSF